MKHDELLDRIDFTPYSRAVAAAKTVVPEGRVSQVIGLIAEGDSLGLGDRGAICSIINGQGKRNPGRSGWVSGRKKRLFMPYGDIRGVGLGSRICAGFILTHGRGVGPDCSAG